MTNQNYLTFFFTNREIIIIKKISCYYAVHPPPRKVKLDKGMSGFFIITQLLGI